MLGRRSPRAGGDTFGFMHHINYGCLFHHLQVALYLYTVGDIIEPLGILLECVNSLAGRDPLIMNRIVQAARNVVNCPFELGS